MPVFAGPPRPAGPTWSTLRSLVRLWPYVRPARARLAAATLLAALASCLGLAMPLVLKWLIDGPVARRDPSGSRRRCGPISTGMCSGCRSLSTIAGQPATAFPRHYRPAGGARVPGRLDDVPGGRRHPGELAVDAGPGGARAGGAAALLVRPVRGALRQRLPAGTGPGRRPDDGRRGVSPGYPRHQGLRAAAEPGAAVHRAGPAASRH